MTICLYQFLLSVQFYYTCLFITACLTFACFHGFIFHACVSLWLLLLVLDVVFVIFVPCSVGPIPLKKKQKKTNKSTDTHAVQIRSYQLLGNSEHTG